MKSSISTLETPQGMRLARLALAVIVCCSVFSASARASCSHTGTQPAFPSMPFLQPAHPAAARVPTATSSSTASIVGLWHVFLTSGGLPFDEGYDAWHSDGTEILVDNAPPQPANGAGAVCIGVYKKTGPGAYLLKHVFWTIDANGNLSGSGVIMETVTLDAGANTYHGTFTEDVFDLSGNLIFEATGDLNAERITPD
jgi:hypothetical protein